jgi:hypothetical protein
VTDFNKLAQDATARAALAAGKDAAKRAVDDLLSDGKTGEENAQSAAAKKAKRWRLIAISVLGAFVVIGLVGLLLNYWYWFLAIGLLGIAGLYARHRLRRRLAEKAPATTAQSAPTDQKRIAPKLVSEQLRPSEETRSEVAARSRAQAEARALAEQEVDEELAAMKARLKK